MKSFFWVCMAFLIPGLLLRIPVGGAGILATDIILPIFALVWLFHKFIISRFFPKNSFVLPGLIFLAIAFVSLLIGMVELSLTEKILSGAHVVRFFSLLIFGWSATDLFRDRQEEFFRRLFWIGGIIIGLGVVQFYLIPDISQWSTEGGWDPHIGRLLGTWLDPNFMAGFLGFFLPLVIAKWYTSKKKKEKFLLTLLVIVTCGALFLTFSRSGYLASAVGLFVFFVFKDPKVILLGILLIAIGIGTNERAQKRIAELSGTVAAIVLNETDEVDPTASLRIQSWSRSLELWKKYPVQGIGYNTYRYRAAQEGIVDENYFSAGGSDSSFLTVLVTTGILGLLVFLWMFVKIGVVNFLRFLRTRNPIFLGFVAGCCVLFVHGFFVNSLLFPFILMPFLATAGVLETIKK
jgi:O-antigen ligase